jgi:hypothetical protein
MDGFSHFYTAYLQILKRRVYLSIYSGTCAWPPCVREVHTLLPQPVLVLEDASSLLNGKAPGGSDRASDPLVYAYISGREGCEGCCVAQRVPGLLRFALPWCLAPKDLHRRGHRM